MGSAEPRSLEPSAFGLRSSRAAREVFWVGLGQAAAALGSIWGVRVLTRLLQPQAYGEVALGLTLSTFLQQLVLLPLAGATLRLYAAAVERQEFDAFWSAVRRLTLESLAVITLLGTGVVLVSVHRNSWWLGVGLCSLVFTVFSGANAVFNGIQNAARQRRVVAWHDGLAPWLRFGAAAVLVKLLGASGVSAMLGYAVSSVVVLGSQSWFFSRWARTFDRSVPSRETAAIWRRRLMEYGWPFVTWGAVGGLQFIADRWALQVYASTSDVGRYAALYQLGFYPMSMLSGLVAQAITPVVFQRAGEGSAPARARSGDRLVSLVVSGTLAATILLTAILFLVHGPVFALFAGRDFRTVSWMLPWMFLSGGLFSAGQVSVLSILSRNSSRLLIAPKIASAIAGAGLALAGARMMGIVGVVFAGVLVSASYFAWTLLLVRRAARPAPESSG